MCCLVRLAANDLSYLKSGMLSQAPQPQLARQREQQAGTLSHGASVFSTSSSSVVPGAFVFKRYFNRFHLVDVSHHVLHSCINHLKVLLCICSSTVAAMLLCLVANAPLRVFRRVCLMSRCSGWEAACGGPARPQDRSCFCRSCSNQQGCSSGCAEAGCVPQLSSAHAG